MSSEDTPGALSPDRNWYWDGSQWLPAVSPDGRHRWDGARWWPLSQPASPGRWVRRGLSAVAGLVLLVAAGALTLLVLLAQPIQPVRVTGTMVRFVSDCHVPYDSGVQCAYIDSDPYCYRLHGGDFTPALPDLSGRIGQPIAFVVDKANYETSRTVGDPYCNFEVDRVVLTQSGTEHSYSTPAAAGPEYVGHPRGDFLNLLWPVLVLGGALLAWNVTMEVRLRRRRA